MQSWLRCTGCTPQATPAAKSAGWGLHARQPVPVLAKTAELLSQRCEMRCGVSGSREERRLTQARPTQLAASPMPLPPSLGGSSTRNRNCSLLTRVVAPSPYPSTLAAGQGGQAEEASAGFEAASAAGRGGAALPALDGQLDKPWLASAPPKTQQQPDWACLSSRGAWPRWSSGRDPWRTDARRPGLLAWKQRST